MTADDIVEKVKSYKCPFVEFTGGEPLEQENVYPLMKYFCDSGYTVALETGGHINIAYIDERVIRILDVKCPDSKMQTLNYVDNLTRLRLHDEVKFVIASEGDYEWAKRVVGEYSLDKRCAAVLFSTSFTDVTPKILAEWILRDNLPVRMQLQMHKFIWDPETRGV
jgi:7-carboxy-7-deazaguanine synthase